MPSSSSSNAFARRVSRVSAFPSRTSAIRSARMLGSRKPPRIMPPTRIACRHNGKPFFAYLRNRGIPYLRARKQRTDQVCQTIANSPYLQRRYPTQACKILYSRSPRVRYAARAKQFCNWLNIHRHLAGTEGDQRNGKGCSGEPEERGGGPVSSSPAAAPAPQRENQAFR